MSALLEARGLSVGHGARVVARDIDLALQPGRVLCLLGPNGGGKTTLLRTLLGLIPPLAGQVLLGGTAITKLDASGNLWRWRAGRDSVCCRGH